MSCFQLGQIIVLISFVKGLSSCYVMPWHSDWFGSPVNPSYIPSLYMAHPTPMTFLQRAENTLMHLGWWWISQFLLSTWTNFSWTGLVQVFYGTTWKGNVPKIYRIWTCGSSQRQSFSYEYSSFFTRCTAANTCHGWSWRNSCRWENTKTITKGRIYWLTT